MLEHGADLHNKDEALKLAAEYGNLEVVKHLLELGANLHADNDWALRSAAAKGHLEVVKYLVEQGADLHAMNDWALRFAAKNVHLEVVKYFVERGADLDRLSEEILIELFTSYDLQIKKITPRLLSLIIKTISVEKVYKMSTRNKILSSYRKQVFSSLTILMYRLYYRPSGPAFFQVVE